MTDSTRNNHRDSWWGAPGYDTTWLDADTIWGGYTDIIWGG